MPREPMVISRRWGITALITFAFGFSVLGYLAVKINEEHPPIPQQVVDPDGETLFTADDIMAGQHLFQKYGLMQFGTLFGHGAYLGPDFTAQYIDRAGQAMLDHDAGAGRPTPDDRARVRDTFKSNHYNPETRTLAYTAAQVYAFKQMQDFYTDWFGPVDQQEGLQRPHIGDTAELHDLTAYFSWAAWVATATRPGTD
jgi:nitric oxide reductase subunit B